MFKLIKNLLRGHQRHNMIKYSIFPIVFMGIYNSADKEPIEQKVIQAIRMDEPNDQMVTSIKQALSMAAKIHRTLRYSPSDRELILDEPEEDQGGGEVHPPCPFNERCVFCAS
jgi:hypothetical protein